MQGLKPLQAKSVVMCSISFGTGREDPLQVHQGCFSLVVTAMDLECQVLDLFIAEVEALEAQLHLHHCLIVETQILLVDRKNNE